MFQQTTDPEDARGRHQGTAEEKAKTKAEGTLNLISPAPNHELTDTAKVTEYLIDDNEYPEGGIKAWLTVLGAWCGMVPSMGLLNTHGILQAWVSENDLKELPESQIGWIFSCFTFFLYFGGVLIGPVFDSRDPLLLIVPGSVGCVLTSIFMSFSTGEWLTHVAHPSSSKKVKPY